MNHQLLEQAAREFIAKVERGDARSTASYQAFKSALDAVPAQGAKKHLQCERCGDVAIASGTLCDECAELSAPPTPAEGEEARQLVIEANNSLYGSQGYFHSLNGGPFDKYHLARGIEDMKADNRRLAALVEGEKARAKLLADRIVHLTGALSSAAGYLKNADIDLAAGAKKATAQRTIQGGIKMVEAALVLPDTSSNTSTVSPSGPLMEASFAQHIGLNQGEPARFTRNGKLEICQCRDCRSIPPQERAPK